MESAKDSQLGILKELFVKSLNIVAHPDDDLLFLNPHIAQDMQQGHDVYIVYLTMGDDGNDQAYVSRRMDAVHNAYNEMLNGGQADFFMFPIRSSSYRNGDKWGELYQLYADAAYQTKPVGEWQSFRLRDVRSILLNIYNEFQPAIIRAQDLLGTYSIEPTTKPLDHVDHVFGARIVDDTFASIARCPIEYYLGYPMREQVSNLDADAIAFKTKMWRAYQAIDTSVAGEIWDDALSRCYRRHL
jgi:hypothetical protein